MQSPSQPIIVRVVEENEISGLGDVMMQAVGLTGVIAISALVFGIVLASIIIGYRKFRSHRETDEEAAQTQPLGLTPTENLKSKI
jgi:Na+/H+-dicarboxylate symporter